MKFLFGSLVAIAVSFVSATEPTTVQKAAMKCPDIQKDACLHGHQPNNFAKKEELPRCWLLKDNVWGCYWAVNNECKHLPGMIDLLNPPEACPGLKNVKCKNKTTGKELAKNAA